jgi:hypothetical protein
MRGHKDSLVADVALYIDKRMPQSYYKWKHKRHDTGPANISGVNAHELGIVYRFEENDPMVTKSVENKPVIKRATEKQRLYIIGLVKNTGYKTKALGELTIKEASDIISFLRRDTVKTPSCLFDYLEYAV